jgi:signal transduction histidine kinase
LQNVFSGLLFQRLFLPLLFLSLVTIVLVSWFAYQLLTAQLLSYNQSVVYVVETYIRGAGNVLDTLAVHGRTATNQEISRLFAALLDSYASFDAFYLLDEQGQVAAAAPTDQIAVGLDMSSQAFYQPALILPDVVISAPFISARTGQPTVYLAQDIDGRKLMVAELSLSALQEALIATGQAQRNTIVFVTDSYGNLIAHPQAAKVLQQERWSGIEVVERTATDDVVLYDHDDPTHDLNRHYDFLTATDVRETGWYVVSMTPVAEFVKPYALVAAGLTLGSLTILLLMLRSFLRRFQVYVVNPLRQFSDWTNNTAAGNYLSPLDSRPLQQLSITFNELETLRDDFYRMNQALKQREKELCEAQDRLQEFNTQLEARVSERTTQLETARREMEAFSYSVSHDLRAPLRHINGYTQILHEQYADHLDDRGLKLLQNVNQASLRMAALIDSLLMLSRVSRSQIRYAQVDLSATASEIAAELNASQPERQVAWEIQPGLHALGDVSLLRVLLNNLLGNAWKFTGNTHQARIELGRQEEEGRQVFFVRDNGAGFDMAYVDKLFNPFQRLHTEDEYEGTGIGLALVQRIIHRHGGEIWAQATPGQGAVFSFTIGTKDQTNQEKR